MHAMNISGNAAVVIMPCCLVVVDFVIHWFTYRKQLVWLDLINVFRRYFQQRMCNSPCPENKNEANKTIVFIWIYWSHCDLAWPKSNFSMHTGSDACVTRILPSAVISIDESWTSGDPFFNQWIFGAGTPNGAMQVISARPPASTRIDCGATLNCFLISEK